jgi:PTS system beta-glucosides-specific IIC component
VLHQREKRKSMDKDFTKMAEEILNSIGGKGNISIVVHCATRLRFTLLDNTKANDGVVKSVNGVVGLVNAGGMYQVIIGNDVHEVFTGLEKLGAPTGTLVSSGKQSLSDKFIGTLSGVLAPVLAALMGVGIIKSMQAVLTVTFPGWAASGDMSYTILHAAGDALMYFLPILVAYTASRRFGLDPIVGMVIGGTLLYPSIAAMYPFGPWGIHKFLGLDILVMMRYRNTILPSIFAVYGASFLYKRLRKTLPSEIKNFVAPFFTLIITIPLMFLIIGPVFGAIGLVIQHAVKSIITLHFAGPLILGLIMGAFWQALVIFGLHWTIVAVGIQETSVPNPLFADNCVRYMMAYAQIAVIAQVGAVFAMALKIKNSGRRSAAIAAGIGGVFGITEPIIYGFTLPKKMPFMLACVSGAVSGALAGLFGSFSSGGYGIVQQTGAMGIFAYPSYLLPGFSGSTMNFAVAVLASVLSLLGAFILVYATYKPDEAELKTVETDRIDTSRIDTARAKKIYAPVDGRALPIALSADPAHQQEAMGKGVCFMPFGENIFAPCDGTVGMVFDTKHAISIKSADGVEVLIHCGIDTVNLGGRGFTPYVKEDEAVKSGQLILKYDKDVIARAGYNLETQVVVTNTGNYKSVTQAKSGDCSAGDVILYVE